MPMQTRAGTAGQHKRGAHAMQLQASTAKPCTLGHCLTGCMALYGPELVATHEVNLAGDLALQALPCAASKLQPLGLHRDMAQAAVRTCNWARIKTLCLQQGASLQHIADPCCQGLPALAGVSGYSCLAWRTASLLPPRIGPSA